MRRAERVVYIKIAERGKLLRESGIVFFFLRMEAKIFKQQHLASGGFHGFNLGADTIRCHFYGSSQKLLQAPCHGLQTHFGIRLAFGPAQMGGKNQGSAVLECVVNGRERRFDALVAGDFLATRRQRDVEIDANEHPFIFEIEIANG